MANRVKKSRSTKKKNYRLTNSDLALAATAPAHRRKSLIKAAAGGGGYDYYKGVKTNLDKILRLAFNPALPTARKRLRGAVADACIASRDIKNNQSVADGLNYFVAERQIAVAPFDFPPIALGRAGTRIFWTSYILRIEGKKYIPFLDFRQGRRRLTRDARRFIFSILNTHIRLANPTEYGDVGFVILEFTAVQNKVRSVVPYFDRGTSFWSDPEIGAMIDAVYRAVDEIRKAA